MILLLLVIYFFCREIRGSWRYETRGNNTVWEMIRRKPWIISESYTLSKVVPSLNLLNLQFCSCGLKMLRKIRFQILKCNLAVMIICKILVSKRHGMGLSILVLSSCICSVGYWSNGPWAQFFSSLDTMKWKINSDPTPCLHSSPNYCWFVLPFNHFFNKDIQSQDWILVFSLHRKQHRSKKLALLPCSAYIFYLMFNFEEEGFK